MPALTLIVTIVTKSDDMMPFGLCIGFGVTIRALRIFGEHNDPLPGLNLNLKDLAAVLTPQFPKPSIHSCGICRNRKHDASDSHALTG